MVTTEPPFSFPSAGGTGVSPGTSRGRRPLVAEWPWQLCCGRPFSSENGLLRHFRTAAFYHKPEDFDKVAMGIDKRPDSHVE